MDGVAVYSSGFTITWHAVVMTLAAAAGITAALMLCSLFGVRKYTVAASSLLSFIFAPLFSRLVYWYCSPGQYSKASEALFSFGEGGHSLLGAMVGALCGIMLGAALTGCFDRLASVLDCFSPAAALTIAIGRMASIFGTSDYGKKTFTDPAKQHFPVSVEITESDGATVWRFPTFIYEALAAALIFAVLMLLLGRMSDAAAENKRFSGSLTMLFVAMFSAFQIILESTRYDSLFLRSNGFVSLFQIAGAAAVVAVFAIFSIRALRSAGTSAKLVLISDAAMLALLGTAGGMEYLSQRYTSTATLYHSLMAVCAAGVCVAAYLLYRENEKACCGAAADEQYGGYDPETADEQYSEYAAETADWQDFD